MTCFSKHELHKNSPLVQTQYTRVWLFQPLEEKEHICFWYFSCTLRHLFPLDSHLTAWSGGEISSCLIFDPLISWWSSVCFSTSNVVSKSSNYNFLRNTICGRTSTLSTKYPLSKLEFTSHTARNHEKQRSGLCLVPQVLSMDVPPPCLLLLWSSIRWRYL